MDIGREILDQQLVDRNDINVGKVDGIVVELREGERPRIVALLSGGHLLAWRLHPKLEAWVARLTQAWGPRAHEPIRIPWSKVKKIGVDVKVDLAADQMIPWEHWVRDHIIARLPGS